MIWSGNTQHQSVITPAILLALRKFVSMPLMRFTLQACIVGPWPWMKLREPSSKNTETFEWISHQSAPKSGFAEAFDRANRNGGSHSSNILQTPETSFAKHQSCSDCWRQKPQAQRDPRTRISCKTCSLKHSYSRGNNHPRHLQSRHENQIITTTTVGTYGKQRTSNRHTRKTHCSHQSKYRT